MSPLVTFYADRVVGFLPAVPYVLFFFAAEALLVSHVQLADRRRLGRVVPNLAVGFLHVLFEPFVALLMWRAVELRFAAATATLAGHAWSLPPSVPALCLGMVFMDLGIYVGHRLMHAVPVLWRLHRVHHSDPALSPAVAHLNHPLSALVGLGAPFLVGRLVGIPVESVAAWKSVQAWNAYFQHTQIVLPRRLEAVLELVFILPRHHALHHSIDPDQTNSNYCFLFNFWDRLFGTFRSDPIDANTRFGLAGDPATRPRTVVQLLTMPWEDNAVGGSERAPT